MIDCLFSKYRAIFACERFTCIVGLKFTWPSNALTLYLKSSVNPPKLPPVALTLSVKRLNCMLIDSCLTNLKTGKSLLENKVLKGNMFAVFLLPQ